MTQNKMINNATKELSCNAEIVICIDTLKFPIMRTYICCSRRNNHKGKCRDKAEIITHDGSNIIHFDLEWWAEKIQ